MPVSTIFRLLRIVVLCVAMVNLHGVAAAAYFQADHSCSSIAAQSPGSQKALHLGQCCTKLHCCPILAIPPSEKTPALTRVRPSLVAEAEPFLLVRVLYPPPKPQFS